MALTSHRHRPGPFVAALLALLLSACAARRPEQAPAVAAAQAATPPEDPWFHGTSAEAFAEARRLERPLLICFSTSWCQPCRVMEQTTWREVDVRRFLADERVALHVDAEVGEGRTLAQRYSVTGYPTVLYLDAEGEEADRSVGRLSAKDLMERAREAARGGPVLERLQARIAATPDDWPARLRLAGGLLDRKEPDAARVHLEAVVSGDPENESGATDDALVLLCGLEQDPQQAVATCEHALRLRPDASTEAQSHFWLYWAYKKLGKEEARQHSATRRNEILLDQARLQLVESPDDTSRIPVLQGIAQYATNLKLMDEAGAAWQQLTVLLPDHAPTQLGAANWSLAKQALLEQGRVAARRATELAPDDPQAALVRGRLALLAGDQVDARASLLRARELSGAGSLPDVDIEALLAEAGAVAAVAE